MKTAKRVLCLTLVLLTTASFCACGISKDEAVGAWSGTYQFNGNSFSVAFVLDADGSYSETTYKNGSLSSTESGTWEVTGGDVVLYLNGDKHQQTVYTYEGDALVNNNHKFYKK